ncbi:tRNA(fMet)-specific endonuclease VapC [bacterium YEK0313]|nr:tRNA(fMet)-specific endonuclease VapC [bacterium YEK0313]
MTPDGTTVAVPVYLDANVLIRLMERSEAAAGALDPVWERIEAGRLAAVTSWLSYAEVLVQPLRARDDGLVLGYDDLFAGQVLPLTVSPVTAEVLRTAAHLRARLPALKLTDAIHLATAEAAGCRALLSGDRKLGLAGNIDLIDPESPRDLDRFLRALP